MSGKRWIAAQLSRELSVIREDVNGLYSSSNVAGAGSVDTGVTVDVTCGTTAGLNYRSATPIFARAR